MEDPYDLERFVTAQQDSGAYERARAELGSGRKTSHWMWFVFPQIAGLGSSVMARRYAISSFEEAVAYLRHPLLGPRLGECAELIAAAPVRDPQEILGAVDAMKLRSSMTLFARAAGAETSVFTRVLERCFEGDEDPATVERL